MAIVKRVVLFVLVNVLILTTVSFVFTIVSSVLGIQMDGQMSSWMLYYVILGFGGAFISLALSRQMAKWMMGVRVIDPNTQNPHERRLLETVHSLAQKARLPKMPQVGIYDSPEVNAFATGPTKARALVAVSTGLLGRMDNDAVEGVLGHEVAHIANGDMVTMTLVQGVINTLVLIIARLLANVVAGQVEERSRPWVQFAVFMVLQIVLSILGSIVVCYFSRAREFRADAGGARLAGRDRMLSGLKSLRHVYGHVDDEHQSIASLKISGHSKRSIMALFMTHPPLEDRIRRLETLAL
ncbi:MAG TPA: protease HtpX [Bdellovibrionales bacterium]|nr:protease HtpX [Bdellovibrionales bacterium]